MKNENTQQVDSVSNQVSTQPFLELSKRPVIQIPENRGDFVDQAQDQIECDINEQIYQIRKRLYQGLNKRS